MKPPNPIPFFSIAYFGIGKKRYVVVDSSWDNCVQCNTNKQKAEMEEKIRKLKQFPEKQQNK